ncbi:type II 3-dehydroquinate dehydratase [Candidatus Shikimatogenerans silvanidophilus]|uniref:type II 3-dehydroquinate dehydratase n=1 Tax=Candidatus Shikimatogenerans silvanidophilus TaxID=2782547 RepID=UPI001BA5D905|nr:type II 3-dehydroquinate dehydratase [Candidatus Shikimatogenerans silvanidophilus]
MKKKIIIINGPNLNFIGKREPILYGNISFEDFLKKLIKKYINIDIKYFQTNSEEKIINFLQKEELYNDNKKNKIILLNAGAFSHTSLAIHDAIKSININVIEIHITNIFSREKIRNKSIISPACKGIICGFGLKSYELAINYFLLI